jgi:hypothetical protein
MKLRILTFAAALLLTHAGVASAQAVKLEFRDGLVNLSAQNAPIRAILAEWTRLGGTNIVNGERVTGAPLTLELQGVPERQALDIILRGVAGYMIAARELPGPGSSKFDRVMILPTSTAPRPTTNTATFAPPPRPVPDDFDDDADDDDVDITTLRQRDQEAVRRAEELARQRVLDQANRVTGQPVVNGETGPTIRQVTPFIAGPQPQPQPAAAPVQPGPGQPRPMNPFSALPGSSRPGEVTPPPPQENRPPTVPEQ